MAAQDLLEPVKLYESRLKQQHLDATNAYFDKLVEQSGVSELENKVLVENYCKESIALEELKKEMKKLKAKKGWCTFGIVICFIIFVLFFISIILIKRKKNVIVPAIIALQEKINNQTNIAESIKKEAFDKLSPLCDLFDYSIPDEITNSMSDILKLKPTFDYDTFEFLHKAYGYTENDDVDNSTLDIKSGTIIENPFVIEKAFSVKMEPKTYTGTLTIHWTTTRYDKDGSHTEHHSETLVAHVVKPAPFYYLETWTVYPTKAAPDLSFVREATHCEKMDDKDFSRYVDKKEKEFKKISEKRLKEGKPFTPLSDIDFEAAFNAINRDNEVQYRLLFTPLATKSMLQLLRDNKYYGDDFKFIKSKKINIIQSDHMAKGFIFTPFYFTDFNFGSLKEKFVQYNVEYFKSIYFDLAPLLSIPLYQQVNPPFTTDEENPQNLTSFEHSVMANKFSREILSDPNNATNIIVKTKFLYKQGNIDVVEVTSHYFYIVPHVDYVSVHGGDGHFHQVPVHWDEYIPVEKHLMMQVFDSKMSRNEFEENLDTNSNILLIKNDKDAIIFNRGIFAGIKVISKDNFEEF